MRGVPTRFHSAVRRQRGFVIYAVLVVVLSALLIVTSMLYVSQSEAAGAVHTRESTIERALAWSGLQAVLSEVYRQRDDLLRGELPMLDEEYVLYERGGRMGLLRLLPIGPARERFVAESAKLDVNIATAEMLATFEMIDETLAQRIVSYREITLRRPYQSIAELLRVDGITPELLYGPLDDVNYRRDARGEEIDLAERVQMRLGGIEPRGLADLLTVYGFEPALQRSGRLRINLNVEWSDDLRQRVVERFDEGAANILQGVFQQTSFDDESRLYQVLRQYNVEPENWPDIVDTFTAEEGEFHFGRVNINEASAEVLAALPGIDAEAAQEIVGARERVSEARKETVAWLAMEGIVGTEAYEQFAHLITTRSWTFRLRLAVGEVRADDESAALEHLSIVEVVIDLAGPEPRIAYMRDVTLFDTATALMAAREREEAERPALLDPERAVSPPRPATSTTTVRRSVSAWTGGGSGSGGGSGARPGDGPGQVEVDVEEEAESEARPKQRQRIGRWIPGQ